MPSNTSRLALPYPIPDDSVDVPRDIQALATKLDGFPGLQPTLVSALPGAPSDGQEVYLQTAGMATLGIIWHLRYRSGSALAQKWEVLNGTPLSAGPVGSMAVANATEVALTSGPSITVPATGVYDVEAGVRPQQTAVGAAQEQVRARVGIGGAQLAYAVTYGSANFDGGSIWAIGAGVALNAADVVSLFVQNANAVASSYNAGMLVLRPTRLT